MKKILIVFFIFLSSQQIHGAYCIPNTPSANSYIYTVSIAGINNTSDWEVPYNYVDYTSQTCTLTTCNQYSITLSRYSSILSPNAINSLAGTYFAAWIDYNNDNIFSPSEKLNEVPAPSEFPIAYLLSFSVPSGTTNGLKRMRIMYAWGVSGGLNPCTVYDGEVEDYSAYINIPHPNPIISSNSPVCSGASLNFSATGGTTYSWSGPNNFSSTSQNPVRSNATVSMSGVYSVYATTSGCSASTSSSNIVVNANPTAGSGSNSPVCAGASLNLTSSGGNTYSWTGPNNFSSTSQNPHLVPSGNSAGTYTVVVRNSSTTCTASSTVSVTILSTPIAAIDPVSPLCEGETINLIASGGSGYSWTGPNGFVSSLQNPQISSATTNDAGAYTVIVSNANNCTATATVTVTVNLLPNVQVTSNSPVCDDDSILLSASGGVTFSWTGPDNFTSNNQSPQLFASQGINGGNYIVTVTTADGCTASSTESVVIDSLPVIITSSNSPVCVGDTLNLHASGGILFAWTGPNSFTSNSANPHINNVQINASGNYSVTVTKGNGCSATQVVNTLVRPLPTVQTNSNSPVCEDQNLTLSATGGVSYEWSGPNNFHSVLQSPQIMNVFVSDSGTYQVTVTSSGGCTASSQVNVVINPLPIIHFTSNSPVCTGDSVKFTASGGTSYHWTGPAGFNTQVQNPKFGHAAFQNSGSYTLTITTNNCSSDSTFQVVVNQLPVITTNSNSPVCSGDSLKLIATGVGLYSWSGPNNFSDTVQSPVRVNSNTTMSGSYILTCTNSTTGCSSRDTVNISVLPLPIVNLDLIADTFCLMSGLQLLSGGTPSTGVFTGNGITADSLDPVAAGLGFHTITYTVTDINGCINSVSDSIFIENCNGIFELTEKSNILVSPNPFISEFIVSGIDAGGESELLLFSVDGRLVYKTKFYLNEGKVVFNPSVPAGIYFIILNTGNKMLYKRVEKLG